MNGCFCGLVLFFYFLQSVGGYQTSLKDKKVSANYNTYVDITGPATFPDINEVSMCYWTITTCINEHAIISYASPVNTNEFFVWITPVNKQGRIRMAESMSHNVDLSLDANWHHVCVTWKSNDGEWQVYEDGVLRNSGNSLKSGATISGGGVLIAGQEQDTLGGGFDVNQAFAGTLTGVYIYDHVIGASIVEKMAMCSRFGTGNIFSWIDDVADVYNEIGLEMMDECDTAYSVVDKHIGFNGITYGDVTASVSMPSLSAFTICVWATYYSWHEYSLFSYALPDEMNVILFHVYPYQNIYIMLKSTISTSISTSIIIGKWYHVCMSWESATGVWHVYKDGVFQDSGIISADSIPGGGRLVIGQMQLSFGGTFSANPFQGYISSFNIWDSVLTMEDIEQVAICGVNGDGDVFSWTSSNLVVQYQIAIAAKPYCECDRDAECAYGICDALELQCICHSGWSKDAANKCTGAVPGIERNMNVRHGLFYKEAEDMMVTGAVPLSSLYTKTVILCAQKLTAYQTSLKDKQIVATQSTYIDVSGPNSIPNLVEVSVCYWAITTCSNDHPVISYASSIDTSEFDVWIQPSGGTGQLQMRGNTGFAVNLNIDANWHHICVTWESNGGKWRIYEDGLLADSDDNLRKDELILGGGVFVTGQDQDSLGGGFDTNQAFAGTMTGVHIYDYLISDNMVEMLVMCRHYGNGNIFSWTDHMADVHNEVALETMEGCGLAYSVLDKRIVFDVSTYGDLSASISMPSLTELTVCLWAKYMETHDFGLFSYATPEELRELQVRINTLNDLDLELKGEHTAAKMSFPEYTWFHFCLVSSPVNGDSQIYKDGILLTDTNTGLTRIISSSTLPISGGGSFILGQIQKQFGEDFDTGKAFEGEMSSFNVWNSVLTSADIEKIALCGINGNGDIFSWSSNSLVVGPGTPITDGAHYCNCAVDSDCANGICVTEECVCDPVWSKESSGKCTKCISDISCVHGQCVSGTCICDNTGWSYNSTTLTCISECNTDAECIHGMCIQHQCMCDADWSNGIANKCTECIHDSTCIHGQCISGICNCDDTPWTYNDRTLTCTSGADPVIERDVYYRYGLFYMEAEDMMITGVVPLTSLQASTAVQCAHECLSNSQCKSFQFEPLSSNQCELFSQLLAKEELIPHQYIQYFRTI
uniref:Uncharacterized protein LOC102800578 n=1 Tax=Saccoglossus kowalevskii TaxID=10224 RepID=A0ABM0M0U6_SACKO|nr:PREDICTED: uncharacterized protein LOC102800578 [Saccoglossus kowalevskii]